MEKTNVKAKWLYFGFSVFWAVIGGLLGYAIYYGTHPVPEPQFQDVQAAAPENPLPGVRISYVGSGIFKVPSEFSPGTYVVTASGTTFGCFWGRLKAPDNKTTSIIDGDAVNRGGIAQFTVEGKDKAVKLVGDCTWYKLDDAPGRNSK